MYQGAVNTATLQVWQHVCHDDLMPTGGPTCAELHTLSKAEEKLWLEQLQLQVMLPFC